MDLSTFVSDNLIKLVGASENMLVDFVTTTAKTAKSSTSLYDTLSGMLEDSNESDLKRFSEELYARVAAKGERNGNGVVKEKKAGKKKYALVEMEVEEEIHATPKAEKNDRERRPKHRSERERRRSRSRERHGSSKKVRRRDSEEFEDRWGDEEFVEGEEEGYASPPPKRVKIDDGSASPRPGSRNGSEQDGEDEEEKDRRERIEFEKRLQNRDKGSTKKVTEDRSSHRETADAERRAKAGKLSESEMKALRLRSRQDYLKKRSAQELALLRKQVAEEREEERNNPALTQAEKDEFARNREALRLAEEREGIDDHVDGYALPEDYITEKGKLDMKRKNDALYSRYVDRDEQGR